MSFEEQEDIYDNNREAWGTLSNEAKSNFGANLVRNKSNEVAPYVVGGVAATAPTPYLLSSLAPYIVDTAAPAVGRAADAFAESSFGQKAIPFYNTYISKPLNATFAVEGVKDFLGPNGYQKTVNHFANGEYEEGLLSGLGDIANVGLTVAGGRELYDIGKGVVNGVKGAVAKGTNYMTSKLSKTTTTPVTASKFESELDWSPESWFGTRTCGEFDAEDVAALKSHIPEYLEIERTSKANGTWLKMPDGSTWQVDPRSWVQMQSKAYDAYTGNSPFKYQPFSHSSEAKFDTFDISHFGETDDGFYGRGFYTHPAENINGELIGRNSYGDVKYLLATNVQKPFDLNNPNFKYATLFNREGTTNAPKGIFDGFDSVYYGKSGWKYVGASPAELVVPQPSNYKSLIGNNGDFNPLNNNMYKTLILLPILLGYGSISNGK